MSISEEIKTSLNKLISTVEDETTKNTLRQAVTDVGRLNDVLLQTQNEAATHRKSKADVEKDLQTAKAEIETLKTNSPDVTELKEKATKYDTLVAENFKTKTAAWSKKAEIFAIPDTDKRHATVIKVKDQFHFAPEGGQLSEQQIDENMRLMTTLETAGSFDVAGNDQNGMPRTAATPPKGEPVFK